jgi:hypothetical protein
MGVAEVGEHSEQVVGAGRVDAADPQMPAQQAGDLLELAVHAVDLGQRPLGVAEDHAALVGQLHAAAGAPEHLDPELLLQAPDLLRHRRLAEEELLAGLRQRPVPGHRGDRAQMTKLHDGIVPAPQREVQVILLLAAMTGRNG